MYPPSRITKKACISEDCILDDVDLGILYTCEDSSTCELNENLPTNYSQEYGYMNITYTRKEETSYSCNFEKDFCNWISENHTWQRKSAGRAPYYVHFNDHTTESAYGMYVYVDEWKLKDYRASVLKSRYIMTNKNKCLSFWYRMHGQQILRVYQRESNQLGQPLCCENPNPTDMWVAAYITLKPKKAYEIVITGKVKMGVIAIDDIQMLDGRCNESSQLTCDLDTNICGFMNDRNPGYLQWNLEDRARFYPVQTRAKGDSYYMHIDNRNWKPYITHGYLLSGLIHSKVSACVSFWYYTFGNRVASFKLYILPTSLRNGLFKVIDVSQPNTWHLHSQCIAAPETYMLQFETSFLDNWQLSGIILGDITVTDGVCLG